MLFVCIAPACAVGGGSSPRNTLQALHSAALHGDVAALYALLPERARRQESLTDFRARMQSNQRELRDLVEALDRALQDQHVPYVELPSRRQGAVTVVEDPEGWRLARPEFGPAVTLSPTEALQAFRTALLRQSLPALLQILSSRTRGALQAEMHALIDALQDPASLEVTATPVGQRFEVHLPDGRTIVLVREGLQWRIDDIR